MTSENKIEKQTRVEAFKKIADAKGYTFEYTEGHAKPVGIALDSKRETRNFHYDALMVDQSIRDAIIAIQDSLQQADLGSEERAKTESLFQKLQRLLENGTAYEKSIFSLSSDSYYFPEDVNAMAASAAQSEHSISDERIFSCQSVCYVVCRCIGTHQDCKDMCRWVCNGAKD